MESVIVKREQLAKAIYFSYIGEDLKTYKGKLAAWRVVLGTKFVEEARQYAIELYKTQTNCPPKNM